MMFCDDLCGTVMFFDVLYSSMLYCDVLWCSLIPSYQSSRQICSQVPWLWPGDFRSGPSGAAMAGVHLERSTGAKRRAWAYLGHDRREKNEIQP